MTAATTTTTRRTIATIATNNKGYCNHQPVNTPQPTSKNTINIFLAQDLVKALP